MNTNTTTTAPATATLPAMPTISKLAALAPLPDFTPTPEQALYGPYFAMVADKANWKNPINAEVPTHEVAMVAQAIEFYTATKATVAPVPGKRWMRRVSAPGYYAGPCN